VGTTVEFSPSNAQKRFIATQYVQEYCLQEATWGHVATDVKAEAINTCLHHNSDFAHTLNAAFGIGLADLRACGRPPTHKRCQTEAREECLGPVEEREVELLNECKVKFHSELKS